MLRTAAGFVFAPMIATLLGSMVIPGPYKVLDSWTLAMLLTYPLTLVVALPLFLLLRMLVYPNVVFCVIAGALIGGAVGALAFRSWPEHFFNTIFTPLGAAPL